MELDAFEQEILEGVESGEWKSVGHTDDRQRELQSYLKNQDKKLISIRIPEQDLHEVKKRAMESGIPYQNLMQMLIHQFAVNKIQLTI